MEWLIIIPLAFLQNTMFTVVSRARNRDNPWYHAIASIGSNGVWYMTFRYLDASQFAWILFIPYTFGTVSGSLWGAKVSMKIEQWLGAASDAHLKESRG